ncbi:MAG TPA: DUF2789 domain-containing protein [Rhodocyclaceae bacterium]|nr:DUF2789 domain-containing protein [Rhodocyclaceae bacterium]
MDTAIHTMNDLFAQLGLPAEDGEIDRFIAAHNPVPEGVRLHEADFWSPAQADFLREEVSEDSEWAELIEHLNVQLRAPATEFPGAVTRDPV